MPPLPNDLYKKYHEDLLLSSYDATNLTSLKSEQFILEGMAAHHQKE